MAIGSFSKLLGGFTSDHTYQTATITTYAADGTELSLTGMTWNLLNKGHADLGDRPSNNPFNLEELDKSYEARKKNQLKFLWTHIKKGDLDFMCLQEVDVFFAQPRARFVEIFLGALAKKGWKIVEGRYEDNLMRQLLTLYDAKKLQFVSKRGVFAAQKSGKFTALEATFTYLNHPVCITNMHLDYQTDYKDMILNYQMQLIDEGKVTIITGDANHKDGNEPYGLITDENMPTCIYRAIEQE